MAPLALVLEALIKQKCRDVPVAAFERKEKRGLGCPLVVPYPVTVLVTS